MQEKVSNYNISIRCLLFLVVLVLAAFRRFSLPNVPFADGDLPGYLLPAINFLEHGELSHYGTRSFVYPLFSAMVLKITGSVVWITTLQHILGLLSGMLLFAMFERPLFDPIRKGRYGWLVSVVQLVLTTYFLLTNSIWQFEHYLTSQSLSTFMLSVQLYGMLWLIERNDHNRQTYIVSATVVLLSLITYLLLPRWGLGLPIMLLIVTLELWRLKAPLTKIALSLGAPLLLFLGLFWLPERHLVENYDKGTDYFPFRQFFYVHADMAKSLIQGDIEQGSSVYDNELLLRLDTLLVITEGEGNFPYLGFDADTLFIGGVDKAIIAELELHDVNYMYWILHYDGRILKERTGDYLCKVVDQIKHYYIGSHFEDKYLVIEQPVLANAREMTLEMDPRQEMGNGPIMSKYRVSVIDELQHWQWSSNFKWIRYVGLFIEYLFLPLVVLFLMMQLIFMVKKTKLTHHYHAVRRFVFYLLILQIALVLTVAMVHSFDIYRYGVWFVHVPILIEGLVVLFMLEKKSPDHITDNP